MATDSEKNKKEKFAKMMAQLKKSAQEEQRKSQEEDPAIKAAEQPSVVPTGEAPPAFKK